MIIEIFADLACPWCYIGWHRLKQARARYASGETTLAWRPFQINPDLPAEGLPRRKYLQLAYGSLARGEEVLSVARRTAREEGLPMDLDRAATTPNTLDAHRLVLLASELGCQEATLDRLYHAFFAEGRDLGDPQVLVELGAASGVDPAAFTQRLEQEDDFDRIRAHEERARHLNLRGVPCFLLDGQYVLAGAQEPKTFKPLFDLIRYAPEGIA